MIWRAKVVQKYFLLMLCRWSICHVFPCYMLLLASIQCHIIHNNLKYIFYIFYIILYKCVLPFLLHVKSYQYHRSTRRWRQQPRFQSNMGEALTILELQKGLTLGPSTVTLNPHLWTNTFVRHTKCSLCMRYPNIHG